MTEENCAINKYQQINNLLMSVSEIASRTDERVKMMAEAQQQINFRLNHFIDEHNDLDSRVHVLESKNGHKIQETIDIQDEKLSRICLRLDILESIGSQKQQRLMEDFSNNIIEIKSRIKNLEEHKQGIMERTKLIFTYIVQGAFIILICYILFKMGINGIPIP